ncbi:hypothetical protein Rxycam_02081 [Rubrobacter xylanophilus DSM 9941]|uniref:hypothetical protein n=1 Tax=Rubrobacter xylanophilus TaxID=49319 RepID=UPI001C63C096|nr:hypothetical protein [Rubrobacter xylanophilus]QYJ16248.1 hypothetical protein Rxycam_02081 [Rubrobacter xylanophilus DSM 9941]
MRGSVKLAASALSLALVALALLHQEAREAALAAVALEILLLAAGTPLVLRRLREQRAKGAEWWRALEEALSTVLPRPAARLVATEQLILWCLLRRILRPGKRHTEHEFGYHRRSSLHTILPVVLLLSPAELGAVHLLAHMLSPWPPLKWVLLALGVYGILWLAGLRASLELLPHRLEEDGLRLCYGAHAEAFIPYSQIQAIEIRPRSPVRNVLFPAEGLKYSPEGTLLLPVGGRTDLALRLRSSVSARGILKPRGPATRVFFAADEPERLAAELRRRPGTGFP